MLALEILGVILNLTFVILLLRQNIWCWVFGILGSLLSIGIFINAKLYSESILYLFYVGVGIYGWYHWSGKNNDGIPIIAWKAMRHIQIIVLGIVLSYGLGYYFSNYSDAKSPFLDATSTIFSFIASYLEAQKVLSGWLYWVALNILSIGLYFSRDLNIYAAYSVVLTVLSVVGFLKWRSAYAHQKSLNPLFEELK